MDPQPLLDAIVSVDCTTEQERSSSNRFWSSLLAAHFPQMDIVPLLLDDEGSDGEGRVSSVLRYFDDSLSVSLAGDQLVFRTESEYPGWNTLRSRVGNVLSAASESIGGSFSVTRITMRYLNFFEGIREVSRIVRFDSGTQHGLTPDRSYFRFRTDSEPGTRPGYDITAADHVRPLGGEKEGVVLDLSTWADSIATGRQLEGISDRIVHYLDWLHNYEKSLFVSVMQEEILEGMVQEWEEVLDE